MAVRSIGVFLAVMSVLLVARVDTVSAVGLGMMCDGFAGIKCDDNLWCEHPPGQCGWADAAGKCVVVPHKCPKDFRPVCGCNGRTYGNDCERTRAKVQPDHEGRCK